MAMIHISIAEAARDFAALIEQVNAGAEFMIEDGTRQLAVLRAPMPGGRTLSESIERAEAYTNRLGYKPIMDADFAADMERSSPTANPRTVPHGTDSRHVHSDCE